MPSLRARPTSICSPCEQTRSRSIRRRGFEICFLVLLVGLSLVAKPGSPILIPLLFAAVVPFEKLFPRHPKQKIRRPELGTDIAFALAAPVLAIVSTAVAICVGVLSFAWIPGLLIRPAVLAIPTGQRMILGLVLFDLVSYWIHRWSHESAFVWRFHSVHHSTKTLDWISGLRVHPIDGALLAPPFAFLVAAGFSPKLAGGLVGLQILVGLFLHANVRWRLRALQKIIATPEFHHWHHANEPEAMHSNYSAIIPIWDRLFGTYWMPVDRRPEHYGIDEFVPAGFVAQLCYPLRGSRHNLRALRQRVARKSSRQLVTEVDHPQ
jgi:sterol desaturase/sphingolipid hydroxylase (fatty acid hydroxylase superfamily)